MAELQHALNGLINGDHSVSAPAGQAATPEQGSDQSGPAPVEPFPHSD
jgi:hypothetical protein